MRRSVLKLVSELSKNIDLPEPIYEFGSLKVAGQESRFLTKEMFGGREYVGCDIQTGPGVDKLLDLQRIDMPDKSVGTIIVLDVFEHVERCREAMDEIYRVLKDGGVLIITSVMYFPVHNHPADYWRFTPRGLKSLLAPFDDSIVEFIGPVDFPCTVLGIAFKVTRDDAAYKRANAVIGSWKKNFFNSWQEHLVLMIPPFLFVRFYSLYRKLEKWRAERASK